MRIIGGKHRGRALQVPRTKGVRPTADRVREAIFNILEHSSAFAGFDERSVIDLFAGTGACGLEALSRGARFATFVDLEPAALTGIRRNAAAMGEVRSITLLRLDAARLPPPPRLAATPAALAFLDPPYDSGLATPALQGLAAMKWVEPNALAVVEVGAREPLVPPPTWRLVDERLYGAARVVFLRFATENVKSHDMGAMGARP